MRSPWYILCSCRDLQTGHSKITIRTPPFPLENSLSIYLSIYLNILYYYTILSYPGRWLGAISIGSEGVTKLADPKAKTLRVTLVPKPGMEPTLRNFKELCRRDNLDMSQELFGMIQNWLKNHNYPPGNPQTLILPFARGARPVVEKRVSMPRCEWYKVSTEGKPWCQIDWPLGKPRPEECYSCDTRKYSRPGT